LFSVSFFAQYKSSVCDSGKIFFTSKFSYLLFSTHKTGTGNRWGTNYNKPPGPISTMGQLETLSSSQIIFITLFLAGAQCVCAIYDPQQTLQSCGAKPKRHILTCLHQFLLCRWYTKHRWRCSNHRHLGGKPPNSTWLSSCGGVRDPSTTCEIYWVYDLLKKIIKCTLYVG